MICSKCQQDKPEMDFSPSIVAYGLGYCKECKQEYYKIWRQSNKEKCVTMNGKNNLKATLKRYNIPFEEYEIMLKKQKGNCAICEKIDENKRLAIDHDHKTNIFRGLLCESCNRGIGLFKDLPELFIQAAQYIEIQSE